MTAPRLQQRQRRQWKLVRILPSILFIAFLTYALLLPDSTTPHLEQDERLLHHVVSDVSVAVEEKASAPVLAAAVNTAIGTPTAAAPARSHEVIAAAETIAPVIEARAIVNAAATAAAAAAEVPYYLTGRTPRKPANLEGEYNEGRAFKAIEKASVETIPSDQNGWILPDKLMNSTRNHDNVLFDVNDVNDVNGQILLVLLGRWSESIQWYDLQSGRRNITMVTGEDPAGNPLNNLNHVYSVVVDSLSTPSYKEVWLPCGFHGHRVNQEWSSEYARIVNLKTMQVETGPKLPVAGGACVAAPIHVKGPDHPAHVCVFGGTQGQHDKGTFLPYTSCYDRVAQKWHFPFGRLPYGFDHGNVVHLPSGICNPTDPERILITNFRTSPYGTPHSEIFAFDLPTNAWSDEELNSLDMETPGRWYLYANISYSGHEDEVNAPRDASGLAMADNWKSIVNFGGVHYYAHKNKTKPSGRNYTRQSRRRYSTVRKLDICTKTWSKVGDLGVETFALQTSVSGKLNVAITCGGQSSAMKRENNPWCLVSRIPGIQLQTNRGCTLSQNQIPGAIFTT